MGARETDDTTLLRRHRLSVAQYHRMGEAGIFAPDARVELIEGELVEMAPIGTRHASTVNRLNRLLVAATGKQAVVTVQNPLRLGDHSEPQPDLLLLRPREDFYAAAHPVATDVLLLIEVADSTARLDREIKLPLYARHGVAEVWIVDLDARLLLVHRDPAGDTYAETQRIAAPGVMPLPGFGNVSIDLSGLFG